MGPKFWFVRKDKKIVIEEDKLEGCKEIEKNLFMQNMLAREALLLALPEVEYGEVKYFRLYNDICNALKIIFECDKHAKKAIL